MIRTDRLAAASRWKDKSLSEKAVTALGLMGLALALPPFPGALAVLVAASLLAWRSGVGPADWLALLAPPAAFIATGTVALAVEIDAAGLHLAADGGRAGLAVTLRALAAVAALLLLAATTPTPALIGGLRRLGLAPELAEVALAIYRFIFILQDTAQTMHAVQAARLGTVGWRRRIRSAGLLAASLLPRALDRAHRQEIGLAARGFDGSLRTLSSRRPVSVWGLARAAILLVSIAGLGLAW
ncbi:MAG: cobalt ECF transporter T component CbiQ [Alphaproteobacteria bacterium]|nr:cobalt ECF transporter T component CbiQ [Alphaproteobacteria bacterium]